MTPTEDNYSYDTTSTKEYEPRTCCIAIVRILGEICRAVDGSNAPECSKSRFENHCKCSFPRAHCRGVIGIVLSPDYQTKELHITYVKPNLQNLGGPKSASKLIIVIHYIRVLIAFPCLYVTFCCVILEKCCYT